MSDGIKKVASKVRNHAPQPRVAKSNRMLSLTEPQYSRFQKYCQSKGITTSAVVDSLIEEFLNEVSDDLPPDLLTSDAAS